MNDMGVTQATTGTATQNRGHSLVATDRREITVKGVSEVISFDEANVRLVTVCGILNLEGEGLRIHVLNTKDGTVAVTGQLNGVLYEDAQAPSDGAAPRGKTRSRRLFG
ncbi:MAG: YabP/YqfC family sporulation protein [Clostridia bacterium]|nr:YabP/YqfC family sporulation protein [Clostridia bacterium]